MQLTGDETLVALYGNALDFAVAMKEDLNSFHFLLSFFTTPSEVAVLFEDMNVSTQTIANSFKDLKKSSERDGLKLKEPGGIIRDLEKTTKSFLQTSEEKPSALHFLCAITNERKCLAYHVLSNAGILSSLRTHAYSMLTTPAKRVQARMSEMKQESVRIQPQSEQQPSTKLREKEDEETPQNEIKPQPAATTKVEQTVSTLRRADMPNIKLPEIFSQMGRNLTEMAFNGQIEPVFGREKEFQAILDILGRMKNNNPCLVGPSGSGKTALVEGIAWRQRNGLFPDRIIWELTLSSLISGTEYRGSLEKRINDLIVAVEACKDQIVVFIDEIHLINHKNNEILANMLKPALSRGNFPLIGATTPEEFKKYIATDPAMERRFTMVNIEEPEGEELFTIAINAARSLSTFHKVKVDDDEIVRNAIKLSSRYISGKSQPDKVLSLLDSLGAVLSRDEKRYAEEFDLMELVSQRTGIPVENLLVDGSKILRVLPERMNKILKGQHKAKKKITQLLARRFNRRTGNKPIASFVFAGSTGVGKTEMAKVLASFFFGSEKKMVVFDMSEFQEQHSVSRLIGSPPGYTGFEDGGQLTESFRREPYQLLLLDEIEKAHPKVLTILLQLLEEGRISDSRGFTVNMSEAIIVMTTNLGAEEFVGTRVGFGGNQENGDLRENVVLSKIESFLSPELLNRVDEIAVFTPFSDKEMEEIATMMIEKMVKNIKQSYGVDISIEEIESVAHKLVESMTGKERNLGARAMQRCVEKNIEGLVLDFMYAGSQSSSVDIFYDEHSKKIGIKAL